MGQINHNEFFDFKGYKKAVAELKKATKKFEKALAECVKNINDSNKKK